MARYEFEYHDRGFPQFTNYEVIDELGRGGFATVYVARDLHIGRRVALKVLNVAADRERFERECRILGALDQIPSIVTVYAAAHSTAGQPTIVMEYCDRGSLADSLATRGPMPFRVLAGHAIRLARGLAEAHEHESRVFHRDIKPANVLLTLNGEAKLADFGIATLEGARLGTETLQSMSPPHAPPERWTGDTSFGPAVEDVYSLCSTLYMALTRRPPCGTAEDGGQKGLMDRVLTEPPSPIGRSDVGAEFERVLMRGLEKDPSQRPQTARALANMFEAALLDDRESMSQFAGDAVPTGSPRVHTRSGSRPGSRVGGPPVYQLDEPVALGRVPGDLGGIDRLGPDSTVGSPVPQLPLSGDRPWPDSGTGLPEVPRTKAGPVGPAGQDPTELEGATVVRLAPPKPEPVIAPPARRAWRWAVPLVITGAAVVIGVVKWVGRDDGAGMAAQAPSVSSASGPTSMPGSTSLAPVPESNLSTVAAALPGLPAEQAPELLAVRKGADGSGLFVEWYLRDPRVEGPVLALVERADQPGEVFVELDRELSEQLLAPSQLGGFDPAASYCVELALTTPSGTGAAAAGRSERVCTAP